MAGAFSAPLATAAAPVEKSNDKIKKTARNGKDIGSKKSEKNAIVQAIQMGSNNNSTSGSSSSGGAELNLILFDEVSQPPAVI